MSDQGFIDAILEEPGDIDRRLVYADYLEERDDPRAELIRLEHELAELTAAADRYWEIKPRRNALRDELDPRWLEQLGYEDRYQPLFTELPADRECRWQLMREFIQYWHPSVSFARNQFGDLDHNLAEDLLEERLGVQLPAALDEWYRDLGSARDVWCVQDTLLDLDRIHLDEQGSLIFRLENQSVEIWGIRAADLHQDDPPVYAIGDGIEDSATTTGFAVQTLLLESIWQASITAIGDESHFHEIRRTLQRCDVSDHYWCLEPLHIYEGDDLLCVESGGDGYLYVAARTRKGYEQLSPEMRAELDVTTDRFGLL